MDGRMVVGESGSTYMDSSSLLAHRLTVEPSLSRTTIRFSLGLFSGGVKSTPEQGLSVKLSEEDGGLSV